MPTYTFCNKNTGESLSFSMTISEMEQFEKDNQHLQMLPSKPLIHSGMGLKKPDSSFRDLLGTIKKGNSKGISDSTINDFGGSSEF